MKIILVITTIAVIGLCLAWTTQAAPTWQNTNSKVQIYKSIISQALSQQENSPSTKDKDKEMAATYCKLLYQLLHSISADSLPGSIDDFCKDVEFPAITEPRPEDKSSTLSKAYQKILDALKGTGLNNGYSFGDLING